MNLLLLISGAEGTWSREKDLLPFLSQSSSPWLNQPIQKDWLVQWSGVKYGRSLDKKTAVFKITADQWMDDRFSQYCEYPEDHKEESEKYRGFFQEIIKKIVTVFSNNRMKINLWMFIHWGGGGDKTFKNIEVKKWLKECETLEEELADIQVSDYSLRKKSENWDRLEKLDSFEDIKLLFDQSSGADDGFFNDSDRGRIEGFKKIEKMILQSDFFFKESLKFSPQEEIVNEFFAKGKVNKDSDSNYSVDQSLNVIWKSIYSDAEAVAQINDITQEE